MTAKHKRTNRDTELTRENLERHRDEILKKINTAIYEEGIKQGKLDPKCFTNNDLGINRKETLYAEHDGQGMHSEEIQKALDKMPQRRNKDKTTLTLLDKLKIQTARLRLVMMENKVFGHRILSNPESFTLAPWLAPYLHRYLALINPGGNVALTAGNAYVSAALIPKEDTKLSGIGYGTKFRPLADVDMITVEKDKYNIHVADCEFRDDSSTVTSKAAIRLANQTGHVWLPIVRNVRMVTPWVGISTSTTVDDNDYWVHTATIQNIQVENPRSTAMHLYNIIDPRVLNFYCSMSNTSVATATPTVYVGSPNNVSVGGFFDQITLGNFAKLGDVHAIGLILDKVNETFWGKLICDNFHNNGIVLKNSNRNRFTDPFVLSCAEDRIQIDGTHGGTVYDGSELNYFYRPVVETCVIGIHDESSVAYGCNVFHFPFLESNTTNYLLRGGDPDVNNDVLIYIPSSVPGAIYEDAFRFQIKDLTFYNNRALYWIDSLGAGRNTISLGDDDKLRLKSYVDTMHLNPDTNTSTEVNYNSTGNFNVGSDVTNKPAHIALDAATDIILKLAGTEKFKINSTGLYFNTLLWSPNSVVPVGGIIMFSGTLTGLPANFKLCDGANGTPDLRNAFIKGANDQSEIGNSGGNSTYSHSGAAVDSHSAVVANVTGITINDHATESKLDGAGSASDYVMASGKTHTVNETGHYHYGSNDHVVTQPNDHTNVEPPYYKLAFIMRVS